MDQQQAARLRVQQPTQCASDLIKVRLACIPFTRKELCDQMRVQDDKDKAAGLMQSDPYFDCTAAKQRGLGFDDVEVPPAALRWAELLGLHVSLGKGCRRLTGLLVSLSARYQWGVPHMVPVCVAPAELVGRKAGCPRKYVSMFVSCLA
jgi:hypothetical protein